MTRVVLPSLIRPLLEPRLPNDIDVRWFLSPEEALELAPDAEIGWFDMYDQPTMIECIKRAEKLRWLNSIYAGLDFAPLDALLERGVTVTNGAGINAITIAEYAIMGMLTIAKGYQEVLRAQDRREWLQDSPGKRELAGSKALLLGYGAIGQLVKPRLEAFDVAVTVVRRSPDEGSLSPDEWRARIGDFDWIIVAVPSTPETDKMIGAVEIAAMSKDCAIINVARGAVIDQDALVEALQANRIGGAFLDVTTPEPLPDDHPLWTMKNAHLSMHLSGKAQDKMFFRATDRFERNLRNYLQGEPISPAMDLQKGY